MTDKFLVAIHYLIADFLNVRKVIVEVQCNLIIVKEDL